MRPTNKGKSTKPVKNTGIPENLKNCRTCGKVFISVHGESLCRDCLKKEEVTRNKVMDYVRDNPGVSIDQAIAATGVPDRMVKRMVLEGAFSNDGDKFETTETGRRCALCGRQFWGTGIYCKYCSTKLQRETKNIANQTVDRFTNKKVGEMSTIDKLNAQAAREFELENLQNQFRSK